MSVLANPFDHLKAAASGSIEAQRALAAHCIDFVKEGAPDPLGTLQEGLVFARLAAARGGQADKGRVLSIIRMIGAYAGEGEAFDHALAEGIGLAALMADAGNEFAASIINEVAQEASPAVLDMAKLYQAAMKGAYA